MAKQLTLHNTKLKIPNAPPWICSCSFSRCIKVMIPLVSTCVMHLVHCFSLFFSPGMKREEVKWIELHHFPGVTQEMLVAHLLVLRLPESTPENSELETSQLQSSWWKQVPCSQPGTGAAEASFSWRCFAMRAGNSQASNFETQAGLEVLARKKKKITEPECIWYVILEPSLQPWDTVFWM